MRRLILAATPLLAFAIVAPAFSQGASESPPSPNSGNAMPEAPNSYPSGGRTLTPGTTGNQRMGTVGSTHFAKHPRRHARRSRATHPDMPQTETVPTPAVR